MPLQRLPFQSSDQKMLRTANGVRLFPNGKTFIQYLPTAAINTSTTATSVFLNTAAATVNFGSISPTDFSNLVLPPNCLNLGMIISGKIIGVIKNNTSTPDFTFDAGFIKGPAYTTTDYVAVTTTGNKAMISTATAAYAEMGWEWVVTAIGASGTATIIGKSYWKVKSAAGVPLTFDGVPSQTYGNFDTTIANKIEARITWGTSHANNEFIPKYAMIGIDG